jgi:hypothetical protein
LGFAGGPLSEKSGAVDARPAQEGRGAEAEWGRNFSVGY